MLASAASFLLFSFCFVRQNLSASNCDRDCGLGSSVCLSLYSHVVDYAAVSYTDFNIGKLLDKLDELKLTASTAVVTFGDHGWQLGEHDTWAKMTNFEVALRTPLIIRAP